MSSISHSTTQAQDQPESVSPQPNESPMDLKSKPNDAANNHQAADEGLPDHEYPFQLHAGKVGLGPHYAEDHRATIGEQVAGLRETIKGRLKHDPQLQQHGHERMTGELKRKEHEKAQNEPFTKNQDSAGAASDNPKADEMPGNDKQQDKPEQQQT